jgi:protein involved in polysaccharide export with SLBB domain
MTPISVSSIIRSSTYTVAGAQSSYGQTLDGKSKNNPYAPSPTGRSGPPSDSGPSAGKAIAFTIEPQAIRSEVIPGPASPAATKKPIPSVAPIDEYRVAANDVLQIKLKNTAARSDYYTVRADGTIDFPLAGENVRVAGNTVDEIRAMLAGAIKLFPDPKLEVTVRDYASHKVTVSGSVGNPGEKSLRREAVPLYVIKAEAMIEPESRSVRVTKPGQTSADSYDLADSKTDNVIVYPGSRIEFVGGRSASADTKYFITGKRVAAGEKHLSDGLTLMQAATAANPSGAEMKKAVVRRRNGSGILSNLEFDLRSVKSGKIADPVLIAGDIIEIRN